MNVQFFLKKSLSILLKFAKKLYTAKISPSASELQYVKIYSNQGAESETI